MKAKFIFLLFITITAHIFAVEDPKKEPAAAAPSISAPDTRTTDSVQESRECIDGDWIEVRRDIPPYQLEMLTKLMKHMNDASAENMPVEVFLIERATWEGIKVNSAFWAKRVAKTVTSFLSYIPFISGSFLLGSVSFPALNSYANMVTEGDPENFPSLKLNYFVELLESKRINDREAFAKLPTRERSFEFETEGFNGLGKGYKGRLVLMDFVSGTPLDLPAGGVYGVISQYGDEAINHLVSARVHKTPIECIRSIYTIPSPVEFSKVGQVWKNSGLHTCILYQLTVNTFSIYVLGMRVPEDDFKRTVNYWEELHRRHHETTPPSAIQVTDPGDAEKK